MIWLLTLIFGVREALSFAAYTPPRFDTFSERIVGKWCGDDEVEEVMRTCGGAVQGIRELDLFSSMDHTSEPTTRERPYHNRADDGFVYFDCGSYTSGSVNLKKTDSGDGTPRHFFMTSLTLPNLPRRRTVLTASILVEDIDLLHANIPSQSSNYISLLLGGSKEDEKAGSYHFQKSQPESPPDTNWNNEVICRMPSTGQLWMLQRVKWEQFGDSEPDSSMENAESSEIIGWATLATREQYLKKNLFNNEKIRGFSENECSVVLQMGAACKVNKCARAIARCYGEDGTLKSIVMQSGYLGS